jgi:hypothetical protein
MVTAKLDGDIGAWARETERGMAWAVTQAMRLAADGAKTEIRQAITGAGMSPKVGNMLGGQVFPKHTVSLGAAGTLHSRGRAADDILSSVLGSDSVILPRRGRYLAVPTGFNVARGHRGRGDRVLVTTERMAAAGRGQTFTLPMRGGGLLWCVRVHRSQRRQQKSGRVRDVATAGDFFTRGRSGRLEQVVLGSGRARRTEAALSRGFVPMFLLLPQVRRAQVVDPEAVWSRWADRVPGLVDRMISQAAD